MSLVYSTSMAFTYLSFSSYVIHTRFQSKLILTNHHQQLNPCRSKIWKLDESHLATTLSIALYFMTKQISGIKNNVKRAVDINTNKKGLGSITKNEDRCSVYATWICPHDRLFEILCLISRKAYCTLILNLSKLFRAIHYSFPRNS